MKRLLPYRIGTRFWVPLRRGGFARGLVARMNGKGVVFAYFFGPRISEVGPWINTPPVSAASAVFVAQVGDLGLVNGEWIVDEALSQWVSADWPLPAFVRTTSDGEVLVSTYDDQLIFQTERKGTDDDLQRFPRDVLMGYGSAEIKLTEILG